MFAISPPTPRVLVSQDILLYVGYLPFPLSEGKYIIAAFRVFTFLEPL